MPSFKKYGVLFALIGAWGCSAATEGNAGEPGIEESRIEESQGKSIDLADDTAASRGEDESVSGAVASPADLAASSDQGAQQPGVFKLAQAPSALAAATTPAPEHESAGSVMSITWPDLATATSLTTTSSIRITVKNLRAKSATVALTMQATGLDERHGTASLGSHTLAASASKTITIPIANIPIQTVGSFTQLDIRGAIGTTRLASKPVYLNYASSYASTKAYTFKGLLAVLPLKATGSTFTAAQAATASQTLRTLNGRVRNSNGTFTAFASLAPSLQHGTSLLPGGMQGPTGIYFNHLPVNPITSPFPGSNARICMNWPAQYLDAGYGEDYGGTWLEMLIPASYAGYMLVTPGWDGLIAQGYLDAEGCTPVVNVFPGSYSILVMGTMHKEHMRGDGDGAGDFLVWQTEGSAEVLPAAITTFDVPNYDITLGLVYPLRGEAANVAATVTQALQRNIPIVPDLYHFHATKGCPDPNPALSGKGACSNFAGEYEAFYGTNPDGVPMSSFKFAVSHEMGHLVQRSFTGAWQQTIWGSGGSNNDACACKHVRSDNNLHCMQGLQFSDNAQTEGFAHYFAALVWNDTWQADCTFNYYKEFSWDPATGSTVRDVQAPPVPLNCATPSKWMVNHCVERGSNAGTELDWLQFFFNITTQGANIVPYETLMTFYNFVCSRGTSTNPRSCTFTSTLNHYDVSYPQMKLYIDNFFGAGSPQALRFRQEAARFGVDY